MEVVLIKMLIPYSQMRRVPLKGYLWWGVGHELPPGGVDAFHGVLCWWHEEVIKQEVAIERPRLVLLLERDIETEVVFPPAVESNIRGKRSSTIIGEPVSSVEDGIIHIKRVVVWR